jgi:uncharacterized protein (DUF58 family)
LPVKPTPKALLVLSTILLLLAASFAGLYPYITGSVAVAASALLGWSLGYAESLSSAASRVTVERSVEPDSTYEDTPVKVTVKLRNPSTRRLEAIVEDLVPARLEPLDEPVFAAIVEPGGEAVYTYRARPLPGLHVLRHLTLSVLDPLGLFAYQRRVASIATVKASPALYPVRGGGRSHYWGYVEAYSRLVRGVGLEFYEIREYQPGDDPRRIVWSATARTGRLMVREDLTETMSRVFLLVDLSAPMWAGTPGDMPGDHAMRVAAALAWAASRQAGRLGFAVVRGQAWTLVQPVRAGEALQRLLTVLAGFDPIEALTVKGWNFCRALDEAKPLLPPDTIILAVSGPHILSPARVEKVSSCLAGLRSAVLVILPRGKGQASMLLRSYGLKLAEKQSARLASSGVRVFASDGPNIPAELWRWMNLWL